MAAESVVKDPGTLKSNISRILPLAGDEFELMAEELCSTFSDLTDGGRSFG